MSLGVPPLLRLALAQLANWANANRGEFGERQLTLALQSIHLRTDGSLVMDMEFYACESSRALRGFEIRRDTVLGNSGELYEDIVRSRAVAEHNVTLLNKGLATVERHRDLGCRIVPIAAIAHVDYRPSVGAKMLRDAFDDRMFPDDGDVPDPFHL